MNNRQMRARPPFGLIFLAFLALISPVVKASAESAEQSGIPVKHIYKNAVYLEAGSNAGITVGQRLLIKRESVERDANDAAVVGEIEIESVAATSAAGRIISSAGEIRAGDRAYLSQEDLLQKQGEAAEREIQKYAQVVSFTEGKPPEQEIRENIPRPPLPEINRFRGRFGTDYSALQISDQGITSSQFGFVLRLDAQRLGGTHWNITGYHRGLVQRHKNSQLNETLSDLINRTYQFNIYYDNPKSRWVGGAGRLYVPYASSLSTIDGFYFGRRLGHNTVGIFGGTTPNPSSWNYDPDRRMAGVFFNIDHGSFENWRFSSTTGVALSWIHWTPDRQFGFFENGIFYKHFLSIYSNQEADIVPDSKDPDQNKITLSRSYVTVRLQPHKAVSFDINENYFRNVPTFDPRLIGTGLVDKFLFQGVSGGFRLELPYRIGLFANSGRSSRTGDQKASWNYLGGVSASNIFHSGIRAEYRYTKFDSSFGKGSYQTITAARLLGEGFRFEVQGGQQRVESSLTSQSHARFVNGNIEWYLRNNYFLGVGVTVYRGQVQSYNQYFFNVGYRFDNRRRRNE